MRIGLWSDNHNFPSLPLMKLSAYHKRKGDITELWDRSSYYDRVYMSKVFSETTEPDITNTDEIVKGGSGYNLENRLTGEIEHICPDYGLYPQFSAALGWLTRGCPCINHSFCITPAKDGCKSIKVADVTEFWRNQKEIVLLDQNLLACPDKFSLLRQLAETGAKVDYTGGLDVRYVDKSVISALKEIPAKGFHFAWDDPKERLQDKYRFITDCGLADPNNITVYVLTNYWSTHEEDLSRIITLRECGLMPYVMIFDKQTYVDSRGRWLPGVGHKYSVEKLKHFKRCQHLQRWCNTRKIIKLVPNFKDYQPYINWVAKGCPVPDEHDTNAVQKVLFEADDLAADVMQSEEIASDKSKTPEHEGQACFIFE